MDATRFSLASAGLLATLLAAGCGDDAPADADAQPIDGSIGIDGEVADARLVDATPLLDSIQPTCAPVNGTTLTTEIVADDLDDPVLVTAPPGDGRLFVVEQPGRIRIIKDGALLETPFLDLSDEDEDPVNALGNEQGLLGLAFHPSYAANGRYFVYYTAKSPSGALVIAEYHVSANPDISETSEERLLAVPHSSNSNHNGGTIEFGPNDGFLYAGTGDGGSGGDPPDNAENNTRLLGKMLRIDVDQPGTPEKPYGIPASNPFADSEDGPGDPRPEIWAIGVRNPYRFTFDTNGDLYIGDVGQDAREEIDVQPANSEGGENYGWDIWEGNFCHEAPAGAGGVCPTAGYTEPVTTLTHLPQGQGGPCAITGGAVYRGACFPDIEGWYFYTDYCEPILRTFTWDGDADDDRELDGVDLGGSVTSLHTDALGEIYLTNRGGSVRHLVVEAN
jgi:glucose/arabinose dehydrogenase